MPIIGIEGGLGAGKTLVMTYLAVKEHKAHNTRLFANYHLRGVPFTLIDFETLLQMSQNNVDLQSSSILIDEAHVWVDSRTAAKKLNRMFSYFMLQTGKEDINLYYTTQNRKQVDVRLRQRTDIWIVVTKRGDLHPCVVDDMTQPGSRLQKMIVPGKYVWPYYNTREKVKPPETL